MRRFFTEARNIKGNEAYIYEDSKHIEKVLRMNTGDELLVFDGSGYEYTARLVRIEKSFCVAEITDKRVSCSEPKTRISLFQGLPKSGKMETIIQKAVELGVYEIYPVVMDRCVTRITGAAAGEEKARRWNKVSVEAVKQCGRGCVPVVHKPVAFKEAVEILSGFELSVMPYELLGHEGTLNLRETLDSKPSCNTVGIIVGPEGGFSDAEAELAAANGIKPVGLGSRILRTETVSGALIPVIMFYKNEF